MQENNIRTDQQMFYSQKKILYLHVLFCRQEPASHAVVERTHCICTLGEGRAEGALSTTATLQQIHDPCRVTHVDGIAIVCTEERGGEDFSKGLLHL